MSDAANPKTPEAGPGTPAEKALDAHAQSQIDQARQSDEQAHAGEQKPLPNTPPSGPGAPSAAPRP